jgi:site-specific DNA-cytosine methylase
VHATIEEVPTRRERTVMLAKRKYDDWSMTEHQKRSYDTEIERQFFERIENPKPPTEELKELFREYGNDQPRD